MATHNLHAVSTSSFRQKLSHLADAYDGLAEQNQALQAQLNKVGRAHTEDVQVIGE